MLINKFHHRAAVQLPVDHMPKTIDTQLQTRQRQQMALLFNCLFQLFCKVNYNDRMWLVL